MHIQIVFYSSTGNTRKTAELLASTLGVKAIEITCKAYTKGFLGPFRQAWDILKGNTPPIEVPPEAIGKDKLLVLGCPVWSAKPAPPMRTFLRKYVSNHENLAAFVTCRGTSESHPPENALLEIQNHISQKLGATAIFREIEISDAQFPQKLDTFANELRSLA